MTKLTIAEMNTKMALIDKDIERINKDIERIESDTKNKQQDIEKLKEENHKLDKALAILKVIQWPLYIGIIGLLLKSYVSH